MRTSRQRLPAPLSPRTGGRLIVSSLLLILVAAPATFVFAAGSREKEKGGHKGRKAQKESEQRESEAAKSPASAADAAKGGSAPQTGQPGDKPVQKPAEKSADKPGEKTADKPSDKPSEKPADKAVVARKIGDTTSLAAGGGSAAKAVAPALAAARSSRETLRKLPGYTCTFTKQEQLRKNSLSRQTMTLKFRREPFSVYLKYIDPNPGREVLYVDGRNDGKFHVHEATGLLSLVGTVSLQPTSSDAMKENRYPVTMIGMEKMLEVYIADWEESQKHADTRVQCYPQARLGDAECIMFEVVHPEPREPFKYHTGRVYFDKKLNLPIKAEQFAFPAKSGKEPQLVEEYHYIDVKLDATPSEKDFDVNSEKYGFK